MKTYVYDMVDEDGITYGVSADAEDWDEAESIADRKGWTLLGEFIEEFDCPPEIDALIELRIKEPVVH